MKKQGKQLNILNGLFLKNGKDQDSKLSSMDIPEDQGSAKLEGRAAQQKEMNGVLGRSMYASKLKAHKLLLEKYIQQSDEYFKELADYKQIYVQLNINLKEFNLLSQKIANEKQNYTIQMSEYDEIKRNYAQCLRDYQEIAKEYERIIQDKEKAHKKFSEDSLALKKINDEVQSLVDKKAEKNETFIDLKKQLAIEEEQFKSAQSGLNGIISVYQLLKKNYEEKKVSFEEARKKYHHANIIKNDWETLTKDFEKTKSNKEKFEKNLISIEEKLKNIEEKANTSKEIYNFVESSLISMGDKYNEHKKSYEASAIAYNISKKTYDAEHAKYDELKANLDEMNSLSNPSQVIVGYITHDLEVAKRRVDVLSKDFYPLEEKYNLQKSIFEQISQSYKIVKKLVDEKKEKSSVSGEALSQTLEAQKKITMILEVLKSKYGLLNHQRGQSEEHFRVISKEYKQIEKEFQEEQQSYGTIKKDYIAFENRYNSVKASYDDAKHKLAESEENIQIVEKAYSDISGLLRVSIANKESILGQFKESEKDFDTLTKEKEKLDFEIEHKFFAVDEVYQKSEELYHQLSGQYESWQEEYPKYSETYKELLPKYQIVSDTLGKLNQKYETIFNDYKALEKSKETTSMQYQQEMQKYNSEQEFYNRVSLEFNKCIEVRNNALKKQNDFETALKQIKNFLFKNNTLTFPIGEATGYNFIDEFNIPEILEDDQDLKLKNRTEFSQWLETYQSLYSIINNISKEFSQALNEYQKQLSIFIQIGGKQVISGGNTDIAYRGTKIEGYLERLEINFDSWQAEYFKREKAFALLVKDYKKYLDESIKLNNNISKMSDSKNGLQEIVDAINSLPSYMDVYSLNYRDVQFLAKALGTEVTELTHLRSEEELKEVVQKVYSEHILNLIDTNLDNTTKHFTEIRSNYDQSIINLKKQLDLLEKLTGIPTRKITIESSSPNDFDLKGYFKNALADNVKQLLSTITGSSSFINSVKKVSQFKRVQNLLSVNEGGNAIILPEIPLVFNEKNLDFSVVIANVKNIETPVKVEKLESTYLKPEKPDGLDEKPKYIEDIVIAEEIKKEHKKLDKKEVLKALA